MIRVPHFVLSREKKVVFIDLWLFIVRDDDALFVVVIIIVFALIP